MTKEESKRIEDLKYIDELFSELVRRGVKQVFDGLLEVRPMFNINIINKENFDIMKKFKKEDLEDLLYDLIEKAGEHYDNALNNISFKNDNPDIIIPLDFLIFSLPDDFELNIPDKVFDWYKNPPQGVCLVDILNKENFE